MITGKKDLTTLLKLSNLSSNLSSMQESELEIAWAQARADIAAGRYVTESAENHVKRLIDEYNLPIDSVY